MATGTARFRPIAASAQVAPVASKPPSLYEVLRVKETASVVEIKAAYRSLAKRLHPDAAGGGSDDSVSGFIEIHRAYATLSDPAERARYDLSIGVGAWPSAASPHNGGGFGGRFQTRRWETDQCW
ncbi:Chaperone protein dnaJ 11 [Nymphaea thermarum]|nr:Chaperone protein dnaJ 11 [Nymphaea thermarum]